MSDGAPQVHAAILGPGNIGTDLMLKLRRSRLIEPVLVTGIDPASAGLALAESLGIATSTDGVDAVLERDDVDLVFDATGARPHREHAPLLRDAGLRVVDLTPAAVGPYVVPGVNLDAHLDEPNVNLVSCGGQATIPIVHALRRVAPVAYAEVVATIASASAGPGTRQNIDEFTRTTADGVVRVGGVDAGKAIIILNPADPPILMRDTIYATVDTPDEESLRTSVTEMVEEVQRYVPGYRLILFDVHESQVTVTVEVEGAGDFLPRYAGNLDIMTSAAVRVGEVLAERIVATNVGSAS
jgi:acetaldehyde dehydrogenase